MNSGLGGRRIWGVSNNLTWSSKGWRRVALTQRETEEEVWGKSGDALSLGPAQCQVPTGHRPRAGSRGVASVRLQLRLGAGGWRGADAGGWALRLCLETGCIMNWNCGLWSQGWGSRAGQLSNWAMSQRGQGRWGVQQGRKG